MTIKTTFTILATATALTGWAAAPAKAEITSLGDCINAVITWCNDTFGDNVDCSQSSGIDDCKEVFGDKSNQGQAFQLILPGRGGKKTVHLILPAVQQARETAERDPRPTRPGRDRDDGGLRPADIGELTPLDPSPRPTPLPKPRVPSPADSIDLSPSVPGV